jgi:hypothetical protein
VGDSDLEVLRVVRGPRPVGLGAGPDRLLAALAEIRRQFSLGAMARRVGLGHGRAGGRRRSATVADGEGASMKLVRAAPVASRYEPLSTSCGRAANGSCASSAPDFNTRKGRTSRSRLRRLLPLWQRRDRLGEALHAADEFGA